MNGSHEKEKRDKMADDLGTIKSMLLQVENNPLIEPWAFYVWGTVFVLGGLLHYVLTTATNMKTVTALTLIWAPLVTLASLLELAAWILKMRRESIPLLSGPSIKLWLSVTGTTVTGAFVVHYLIIMNGWSHLPGVLVLLFSVYYHLYAQAGTIRLYVCSFGMTAVGTALLLLDFPEVYKYTIGGLACSLLFFAGGIISKRMEIKTGVH